MRSPTRQLANERLAVINGDLESWRLFPVSLLERSGYAREAENYQRRQRHRSQRKTDTPLWTKGAYMSKRPIIQTGEIEVYTGCNSKECGAWLEGLATIRHGRFVGIGKVRTRNWLGATRREGVVP